MSAPSRFEPCRCENAYWEFRGKGHGHFTGEPPILWWHVQGWYTTKPEIRVLVERLRAEAAEVQS